MILKFFIKLVSNIIPIILMTIGQSKEYGLITYNYFNLSSETISLNKFMLTSFIVGLMLIYAYYPLKHELFKRKIKRKNKNLIELAKEMRNVFNQALGKEVKIHNLNLNVRKYKPVKWYRVNFKDMFKKKFFEAVDFDFLNNSSSLNGMRFEVEPMNCGLVGVAYAKKSLVYDDKLTLKERHKQYNLNNIHTENHVISKTDFAVAKPVIDKNNKVVEIITFDTEQDVEIPTDISKKKSIENMIRIHSDIYSKILTNLN